MQPASNSSPISVRRSPLQSDRQRTVRIDVCEIEHARAMLEHFDQTGLVQHRIGVGRAGEAGDAARHRRRHFGFQRGAIFEPRLAQSGAQIDQARRDDEAGCIDHAVGVETLGRLAPARPPCRRR
jgi:hypothetical protein